MEVGWLKSLGFGQLYLSMWVSERVKDMASYLNKEIVTAQMQITKDVIGAWKAQLLFTLNELGVFCELEKCSQSVQELSTSLNIPEDSLNRALNAAVAAGYILKTGDGFSNAPYVQAVMNKNADGYLGNWLQMYSRWYSTFAKLPKAVKEGRAVEDVNAATDQDYHLIFINGMKDYASYRGSDLLNHVDLSNVSNLLDVGCGPGIYVGLFCEKYPQVRCTCYDVPQALTLAKEHLGSKGLLDRVTFQPGNYLTDSSFGEMEYDVVFISHVLHQESQATCEEILAKAYRAVKPGGLIIIQAMYLNDSGTGPLYASFHDLLSLMIFPGGKNYSFKETKDLLTKSGFVNVRQKGMSLFNVNALVIGEKGKI